MPPSAGCCAVRAFRRHKPEYTAIIRYIFPGCELDHIGNTVANLERFGFEVHDVEAWREHYARTTRLWCERLHAARDAAAAEVGAGGERDAADPGRALQQE